MYLVDTSVWIDFLRGTHTQAVSRLNQIIEAEIPFGITGVIYQEILQGAASPAQFEQLRTYFSTQRFFDPRFEKYSYAAAAQLYFTCRQNGITIRSTLDCLIAQICLEHGLILLNSDKDFERISTIQSDLRLESL